MKKISILIILFFCLTKIWSQSEGVVQPPQNAILVPGTADLYTTLYDEPSRMLRNAAVSACGCKGDGWRLPTLGELQIMYSHRYEMDFSDGWYWTGEKVRGEFKFYDLNFKNGKVRESNYDKEDYVRCVWSSPSTSVSSSVPTPAPIVPQVQPPVSTASNAAPIGEARPTPTPTESVPPVSPPVPDARPVPPPQDNGVLPSKNITQKDSANGDEKPYIQSFGIVGGSLNGLSFKVFPKKHFAISIELGVKSTPAIGRQYYEAFGSKYGSNYSYWYWKNEGFDITAFTLEVNVNFMRVDHFVAGLYGLVGGGPSFGWHFRNNFPYHYYQDYTSRYKVFNGKAGVNALLGLEYVFKVPLALQADFRPGYGLLFDYDYHAHYFDWGLNISLRYTFK